MPKAKQSRKNFHATLRRRWRKDGTYDRLVEWWGAECCWICEDDDVTERKLDIDHSHQYTDNPKPRGLLCRSCNWRLGKFLKADPRWLRRAADYLERTGPSL